MKNNRVIISGGGTAGHIFPAISIAEELNSSGKIYNILFVGAKKRMEMQKVPLAGYKIKGIWIDGFQRSLTVRNFMFPFKLGISLIHSLFILLKFNPKFVVGTGGFASGPVLFAASILRIPTLIHEQNSFPGITNRLLSKLVDKICVSYDGMESYFPNKKIVKTGNPIRKYLYEKTNKIKAVKYFDLDPAKKTILIVGGSLGAEPINKVISKKIFSFSNYQIIWQTGKSNYKKYKELASNHKNINVYEFIEKMNYAYCAADIIISRAGALAIAEICFLQKTAILVPSPYVSENHQMKNAEALVSKEACILIEEHKLETNLIESINKLLEDTKYRQRLASNAKSLSFNNSSSKIVKVLNNLIYD